MIVTPFHSVISFKDKILFPNIMCPSFKNLSNSLKKSFQTNLQELRLLEDELPIRGKGSGSKQGLEHRVE
jgi:hypothetical protein